MRGRQFSYYVTREDWSCLLEHLAEKVQFDIYTKIFRGDVANALTTVQEVKTLNELSFCLTNPGNRSIVYGPFGAAVGSVGQFIIDEVESEAIGMGRSYIGVEKGHEIIRRARMFYAPQTAKGTAMQDKSDEFLSLAGRVFRRAKSFLRHGSDGSYYGPEASTLKQTDRWKFVM